MMCFNKNTIGMIRPILLTALFSSFSSSVLAWRLEPEVIKQPEGSVIQMQVFIETNDWVLADDDAINTCAGIGYAASKVARYKLKRIDGTARFTSNPNVKDLHLSSGGTPTLDPTVLYCGAGHYPTLTIDTSHSIHLHNDDEEEGSEQAKLELWYIDIEGDEHYVTSTSITIDDTAGNTNECQMSALTEGATATGSLSESDCDDSPRGNGFYSDAYTFSATPGLSFSVLANWTGMDGYIYVKAPSGPIVAQNDDFTGSSDSKVQYTATQNGTYTVWVTSKELGVTGDYQITLNHTTPTSDSFGDWVFTSSGATPGQLVAGEELSIQVAGERTGTPTVEVSDSVDIVYLLSADNVLSLEDTQLGSENACCNDGFNAGWQGVIDAPAGNYWVGACFDTTDDNTANNCTEAVELVVEAVSPCSSQSLQCGSVVETALNSEACTDGPQGSDYFAHQYAFTGQAGDTVWLSADWEFDGMLLLKNSDGQLLAENDNEYDTTDSQIEYTLREDGQYRLWATSYSPNEEGAYQLAMDCELPVDGPDLVASAPVMSEGIRAPGELIALSAEVANAGNQAADSSLVQFKLSSDSVIDWSDPQLEGTRVSGLAPATATSLNVRVAAPVTPGGYWIGLCVGPGGDDVALSNNCSPGTFVEVAPAAACEQKILACGEQVSGALDALDCSASPRGHGFAAELFELDVSAGTPLVLDAAWTGLDGFLLLQGPDGSIVATSDDEKGKLDSRIEHAALDSGIHRVWATSARRSKYGSFNLQLTCGSASAADLTPVEVTLESNNAMVDSSLSVSARIANAGGSASSPAQASIVLSVDDQISMDDMVVGTADLTGIDAAGSLEIQATATMPSAPGTYWLGVCTESVADEALTKNNCSSVAGASAARLSLSSGAACSSSALECGDSRSGTLGADDCDLGPRGPGYVSDRFSFSGTAGETVSIAAEWAGLDGALLLQSPSGKIEAENDDFQGKGRSRIEHVLKESGNYRLWSVAEDQQQAGTYDLEFSCNASAGPDLHIDPPNLERSQLRPGQKLPLTVQVVNLGGESAPASRVRYFLSENPQVAYQTDRLLGSSDVPELQVDESVQISRTLVMNVKPGLYWLGACVDNGEMEPHTGNNCAYHGPLRIEDGGRPIPITAFLNDAWYNPETAGQGFFINVFPDNNQMFLSWFTYDLDRPDASVSAQLGDPGHRWFTAFGTFERGQAKLDVMLNQGGVFDQAAPAPEESVYGSMTVTFSDCNTGEIVFDIPSAGEPEVIPITRITSDNLAACEAQRTLGDAPQPAFAQQESVSTAQFEFNPGLNDAWYNPATGGQGLFFNVFPDKESVFVSWFTYDTERPAADTPFQLGEPGHRWLTALGSYHEDSAELKLYKVDGGVFNSAEPVPGETEYGSLLVQFDDCGSGELIYDLPSLEREGLIPLQRIVPDSVPRCESSLPKVDAARLNVTPADKQVLENFCGGSANWSFDWPDSPRASGYIVELWRNDAVIPMSFRVSGSEFQYRMETAVEPANLGNWKWRYRPVYPATTENVQFSPMYTFSVGGCEG